MLQGIVVYPLVLLGFLFPPKAPAVPAKAVLPVGADFLVTDSPASDNPAGLTLLNFSPPPPIYCMFYSYRHLFRVSQFHTRDANFYFSAQVINIRLSIVVLVFFIPAFTTE